MGILPRLCIFVPPNLPVEIVGATIFIVYFGVSINLVLLSYYWLAVYPPNLSCVVQVCCELYLIPASSVCALVHTPNYHDSLLRSKEVV